MRYRRDGIQDTGRADAWGGTPNHTGKWARNTTACEGLLQWTCDPTRAACPPLLWDQGLGRPVWCWWWWWWRWWWWWWGTVCRERERGGEGGWSGRTTGTVPEVGVVRETRGRVNVHVTLPCARAVGIEVVGHCGRRRTGSKDARHVLTHVPSSPPCRGARARAGAEHTVTGGFGNVRLTLCGQDVRLEHREQVGGRLPLQRRATQPQLAPEVGGVEQPD